MTVTTATGTRFYIGPAIQPSTDTQLEYEGLAWVEVGEVESIGDIGDQAADVAFSSLKDTRAKHLKGQNDAGTLAVVCGRDPRDVGQIAMKAAQATKFTYAFKVVAADRPEVDDVDSVYYFAGMVLSDRDGYGGADSVVKTTFNVGVNTEIVEFSEVIGDLVSALIDSGVWAKLDQLYVLAVPNAKMALVNWRNSKESAAAINSPAFTANRGYIGNGSNAYLRGNAIAAGNFTMNSASMFAWSLTDAAVTTGIVGNDGFLNTTIRPRIVGGTMDSSINDVAGLDSVAVADSLGLFTISRGSSGNYSRYKNTTALGAAATASSALATGNLVALRDFNSFGSRRVAAFGSGGFLTAADVTALYNALYAYLHDSTVGAL
jgi:hypothetical protein